MEKYIKMLGEIKDKSDFIRFMELYRLTVKDLSIKGYLESIQAWVEDMDGYYKNTNKEEPKNINWDFIATLLYVGSVYE